MIVINVVIIVILLPDAPDDLGFGAALCVRLGCLLSGCSGLSLSRCSARRRDYYYYYYD